MLAKFSSLFGKKDTAQRESKQDTSCDLPPALKAIFAKLPIFINHSEFLQDRIDFNKLLAVASKEEVKDFRAQLQQMMNWATEKETEEKAEIPQHRSTWSLADAEKMVEATERSWERISIACYGKR